MALLLQDDFTGAEDTDVGGRTADGIGTWSAPEFPLVLVGDGTVRAQELDFGGGPEYYGSGLFDADLVGATAFEAGAQLTSTDEGNILSIQWTGTASSGVLSLFRGASNVPSWQLLGSTQDVSAVGTATAMPWTVRTGRTPATGAIFFSLNGAVLATLADETAAFDATAVEFMVSGPNTVIDRVYIATDGTPDPGAGDPEPEPEPEPEPTGPGVHVSDEFDGLFNAPLTGTVPAGSEAAWVAPAGQFKFSGAGTLRVINDA